MKWKQRELEFKMYKVIEENQIIWDNLCNAKGNDIFVLSQRNIIIVQYIRETDSNREKIFEGDILKVELRNGKVIYGYVDYNTGISAYILSYKGFNSPISDFTSLSQWNKKYIIGNVFQNPELIKKYKLKVRNN